MKQFIFYGGCSIENKTTHGPMNIFYINFQTHDDEDDDHRFWAFSKVE